MRTIFPKWPPLFFCFVWTLMLVSVTLFCLRRILSVDNEETTDGRIHSIILHDTSAAAAAAPGMTTVNYHRSTAAQQRPIPLKTLRDGTEMTRQFQHPPSFPERHPEEASPWNRGGEPRGRSNCDVSATWGRLDANESREQWRRSMEFCNVEGSVGRTDDNQTQGFADDGYQIRAVATVMRHGYRSPMYTLPSLPGPRLCCKSEWFNGADLTAKQNATWRRFLSVSRLLLGNRTSPAPRIFRRFGLFPNSENCYGAQLTVHGTLQMLGLGQYFRSRYLGGGSRFMSEADAKAGSRVYVRTTEYTRTFQSAMAFIFGFLETPDLSSIEVETSKNLFLCPDAPDRRNLSCNCPAAIKLSKSLEAAAAASGKTSEKRKTVGPPPPLRSELERLLNVSSNRLPNNGVLLEVFMSHVCHGLGLPCAEPSAKGSRSSSRDDCVTWDMVNGAWRQLDVSGGQRVQRYDGRLLGRLQSYPLLNEILRNFVSIAEEGGGESKRVFFLYSGHDKTVAALADGLRVGDGRWPPFGSHLVFELVQQVGTGLNRFFVRILYNANDVTERVMASMTAASDLVPGTESRLQTGKLIALDDFAEFVLNRTLQRTGKSSYAEICEN